MLRSKNALPGPGFFSVLCVLAGLCASCNSIPASLPGSESRSTCPARVFCLRGPLGVVSRGLTDLADELQRDGIDAVALNGSAWPQLADNLVKAYAGVESPGPLVLIGHSYGTDNAVNTARALNARQIPVRLLISLDGISPGPVPPNVDRCVHLYIPARGTDLVPDGLAGRPIALEPGNDHTNLQNIEVTPERFGAEVAGLSRFNLDTNPAIQRFVMDEILPLCTGAGPQQELIPTGRAIETASK